MPKLPWFKFNPSWWITDTDLTKCTPATRGVWIDLLCAMHQSGRSGELSGTTDQIARLARCSTAELIQALTELQATGTADVTIRNNNVTVVNRLMKREAKSRLDTASRVAKHRSNTKCNANETGEKKDVRSKNKENNTIPNGIVGLSARDPSRELRRDFEEKQQGLIGKEPKDVFRELKKFIEENRPSFAEPYVYAWNIFASVQHLETVQAITDHRRRKIATRTKEEGFNYFRILSSIKQNPDYRGENKSGWKVDFNFIIDSEKNYTKILERYKEQ